MSTHNPSADSYLRGSAPTANAGSATSFFVGRRSASAWRSVLLFDLSSLALDDGIVSADLQLEVLGASGTPVTTLDVHRIQDNGSDDGSGVLFTSAGVTYNSRDGTNNWTAAGGDFVASAGASTTWPIAAGTIHIDVRDLVLDAIRRRSLKLALLLKKNVDSSGSDEYIQLASNEHATSAFRPVVTITSDTSTVRKQVINLT